MGCKNLNLLTFTRYMQRALQDASGKASEKILYNRYNYERLQVPVA